MDRLGVWVDGRWRDDVVRYSVVVFDLARESLLMLLNVGDEVWVTFLLLISWLLCLDQ